MRSFASSGRRASRGRWRSTSRRYSSFARRSSSSPSACPIRSATALGVAFGLHDGLAPSPFLVGLGVLGLLSEAAEEQPLLCLVDDAQWLDRRFGQVLAFVARRLLAERIALVFATRQVDPSLARLAELRVEPLGRRDARALLESVLPARLDESVLERIVAETGGNPLALLELPHGLTPAQLAGGFGLPSASPLSVRDRAELHAPVDAAPA